MIKIFKMLALLAQMVILISSASDAKNFQLTSPNNKITVKIHVEHKIRYSIFFNGNQIITPSPISMHFENGTILGLNPIISKKQTRTVDEILKPVIKIKTATITDHCNELILHFKGNYALIFRAYDDGIAYRFVTMLENDITVIAEQASFHFKTDYFIYFPEEESFFSHSERIYPRIRLSEITANRMSCLPALVDVESGVKIAIAEADLEDYPGMYLTGSDESPTTLVGKFPYYPVAVEQKRDRDVPVTKRADYLARTKGNRSFPWRVLVIAERDGDLIESQMIYKLAKPRQLNETSWIKPGKVAWDWWNWNNIYGVDFRAGINTETYKYYIDFASKYGIEYVILDEGWYKLGNLLDVVPEINVEELVTHGKAKNVGIILWVIWKTLDDQLEEALDQFVKWGVKGIKVDFMQRDDQWMVNYYYKIAREAAKRHLLVDFHGAYKPTGMIRTYPNVLTSEGVRGLENSKWSKDDPSPGHNVTIPFIRMLAGPMDYTPGAMINATKEQFQPIFNRPMSQGTRCHQLAMYVVYESPLQMLCDSPSNYLRELECLEFLSGVPTVWDDTRVLDAKIGEYILLARKSGNDWYVGAMTNWTARELEVDCSFLDAGNYTIEIYQDGINVDRNAMDYKKVVRTVTKNEKLNIHLAAGGGWVARLIK
ncbi:glycoside hydrolase family 97 protein [candidate division KSB1 bacterium]|nr:glycoside hydrolase family 97 protein [candidate division KSB1 bacterium]